MNINKLPDRRMLDVLSSRMATQFQLPAVYDDALSYQGLIYKLMQYIQDTIQNVSDWNDWLQDFVNTFDTKLQNTVRDILQQWYDEGLLAEIVSEVITAVQEQIDRISDEFEQTKVDLENSLGEFETSVNDVLVKNFDNISELMSTDLLVDGDKAFITGYQAEEGVPIYFNVTQEMPDNVMNKTSFQINSGLWVTPTLTLTQPNFNMDGIAMREFADCLYSYYENRDQMQWNAEYGYNAILGKDPTMPSGLKGITCSALINLALSGIRYEDSWYTQIGNVPSYDWAVKFPMVYGSSNTWQAHKLAMYFYSNNNLYYYDKDKTTLQHGDIVFLSKRDPEGEGTGGNYFMNIYHVAVVWKGTTLLHSYSPTAPAVNITPLSPHIDDVVVWSRPALNTPHKDNTHIDIPKEGVLSGGQLSAEMLNGIVTIKGMFLKYDQYRTGLWELTNSLPSIFSPSVMYSTVALAVKPSGVPKAIPLVVRVSGTKIQLFTYEPIPEGYDIEFSITYPRNTFMYKYNYPGITSQELSD